jgi:hypothetical protein
MCAARATSRTRGAAPGHGRPQLDKVNNRQRCTIAPITHSKDFHVYESNISIQPGPTASLTSDHNVGWIGKLGVTLALLSCIQSP